MTTASPLIPWVGGKRKLAAQILPMIPDDHTCYCEPFAGAAAVLFAKSPSKVEVLNDLNGELVNLYRVVQHHLGEFLEQFKWALKSREKWLLERSKRPETLTDIQRAARFFYVHRLTFGSRLDGGTYRTSPESAGYSFDLTRMGETLSAAHLRLHKVQIEHLIWQQCIDLYDRTRTIFYIDPPYYACEDYYGKGIFSRADFAAIAERLGTIKGRFVLSINDHPHIRETFGQYQITEAQTTYSIGSASRSKIVKELLITGGRGR